MYSVDSEDDVDKKYTELLRNELQNIVQCDENYSNYYENICENYYNSNSPLSLSSNNSEISEDDNVNGNFEKEYSIEKQIIDNNYVNKYVNELDLLITFIRGQKKVYLYASFVMRYRFRFLTITSILFTSGISIFTPLFGVYEWCMAVIVILNALTTMMISIVNQLKLESSADNYQNIAMQYDVIETSVEFKNHTIIFMENNMQKKETILTKIADIEMELMKIKESDKTVIPITIRHEFPLIIHLNIFTFIKKIHFIKKTLIEKIIKIKKEIKYIVRKVHSKNINAREIKRLKYLTELKESIKIDLNHCINAYDYMKDLIIREINLTDFNNCCISLFKRTEKMAYNNPIVDDYIKFIIQP